MKKVLALLTIGSIVTGIYVARKIAKLNEDINSLAASYDGIQLE